MLAFKYFEKQYQVCLSSQHNFSIFQELNCFHRANLFFFWFRQAVILAGIINNNHFVRMIKYNHFVTKFLCLLMQGIFVVDSSFVTYKTFMGPCERNVIPSKTEICLKRNFPLESRNSILDFSILFFHHLIVNNELQSKVNLRKCNRQRLGKNSVLGRFLLQQVDLQNIFLSGL